MLKMILIISALLLETQAQTLQWRPLPNAPLNDVKFDDCFFINEKTGWVVNGQEFPRSIYKTTNGGGSWQAQSAPDALYRCVGFADSLRGWIGDLETNRMLQTTNGGTTWTTYTLPSPFQSGVCGIFVLNKDYIFACGRIETPAYFYKTTNSGLNWSAKSMSPLASVLIDCYFWNRDTGIVVGGIDSPVTTNSKPVILYTTNGGNNWTTRYSGELRKQWLWKTHFTSIDTGYASIESWRFTDTVSYLKTTNRGLNWQLYNFIGDSARYHQQGIMFLKNGMAWIGGYNCCAPSVINGYTYVSANNGNSWNIAPWGFNVNRFRYVNDTVMYAVGKTVYKYSKDPIGIQIISSEISENFSLHQNYPNPFNPVTTIKFDIPKSTFITVKIFNALGKEIDVLVNQTVTAGLYSVNWDASSYPSGIYFYKLISENYSGSKKMILIK